MFAKISKYFHEVKGELFKATWPWDPKETGVKKYRQLIDSTIVVVIAMILLAGFVAFNDFIFNQLIGLLTSLF